jgi:hypothetical protein
MILKVSDMDFVFLSVDEPNAEKNFADLKRKVPWAKRVHGVKGFDTAHKKAAEVSETDRFITVDADTQIHNSFLNVIVDLNSLGLDNTYQLSWCGHIDLNGLRYGNGSLKCWTQDFVKNMRTHENHDGGADSENKNVIEFCHFPNYYQFNDNHSISYIDGSAYQAWRAGFREGVKMSLDKNVRQAPKDLWWQNYQRLLVWMTVGVDNPYGIHAIHGARTGCYLTMCTDWDIGQANEYRFFENYWKNELHKDKIPNFYEDSIELGKKINAEQEIDLPITPLTGEQSKFFKKVYLNTPRIMRKTR